MAYTYDGTGRTPPVGAELDKAAAAAYATVSRQRKALRWLLHLYPAGAHVGLAAACQIACIASYLLVLSMAQTGEQQQFSITLLMDRVCQGSCILG